MTKQKSTKIDKPVHAKPLVSAELTIVFILFLLSIGILFVLIRDVFFKNSYQFDQVAFDLLTPYISNANTSVIQFFTFLGSQYFLIPAYLLFITWYYFVRKNKWYVIKFLTISISNLLLMFCLKLMFHRTRPMVPLLKQVPGLSFPSGHAFMSFVFYGLVIYVVYKEVKTTWLKYLLIVLLLIMIFAIGLSRVYLRVHYASDVMAGFSFGMVSLVIILWLLNAVEKLNKKKLAQSVSITQDNA